MNAQRVGWLGLRANKRLDVAQTLPVGELSEKHVQELVSSGKGLWRTWPEILRYTAFDLLAMKQSYDLRENQSARIYGRQSQRAVENLKRDSNASHT